MVLSGIDRAEQHRKSRPHGVASPGRVAGCARLGIERRGSQHVAQCKAADVRWISPGESGVSLGEESQVIGAWGSPQHIRLQCQAVEALLESEGELKCQPHTGGFYGLMMR